jgi:PTH1 family peptidyl-tRNA hydrolase
MKLIIGLGNPTPEYNGTRHNVGFVVVDRLADRHGLSGARQKFHGDVREGTIQNTRVMLIKPTTYMNRSGTSVAEAARFYKVDAADTLVVVDDTALAIGQLRMRPSGSCGGHNGLADIEQRLGTDGYPRLRVGIDPPKVGDRSIPQADYVLGRFTDEQLDRLNPALDRATVAAESCITQGTEATMNRYNNRPQASGSTEQSNQEDSSK